MSAQPSEIATGTSSGTASGTLSEFRSKELLADYGLPLLDEHLVADRDGAVDAAGEIGFPVVAKLCGDRIAHKTERGLVHLGLTDAEAVGRAAADLLARATPEDGPVEVLIAPMVRATRELIAGMQRDPQFGPTVLVGLGGIFAEVIGDAVIGLAPLTAVEAGEMLDALDHQALLGPFRGEPAVDRSALVEVLVGLSRLAIDHPEVRSVDVNPLLIVDGRPVAVDALVEVG